MRMINKFKKGSNNGEIIKERVKIQNIEGNKDVQ